MRLEVSGRLEKDGWAGSIPLLRAASCGLCVHACIKLIIMEEESTKKIFKQSSGGSRYLMALFQYIWVSTAAVYFKGQKSLEPPRKIIKCWWCVVQFLELPLALGVRPEELCARTKRGFI
jgi:hypothetical protein